MNLDEAIKELTALKSETLFSRGQEKYDAIKLGIEALKSIQRSRNVYSRDGIHPLPGETKD